MAQTANKLDVGRLVVLREPDKQWPVMGRIIAHMYDQTHVEGPKFPVFCVEFPDGRVTHEFPENIRPIRMTSGDLRRCGFPCLVAGANPKMSLWDVYVKKYKPKEQTSC